MCKNSRWYSWLGDFVSSAFSANSAVKRDLKKQSQFLKGQNDAKPVMTKVYGDLKVPGRRKNKAKQSQLPNFGDFVLSTCLDKACRKQEISGDKQRYKKGQDTLKPQSWLKKNTPKGSRTPVSRMRT